MGMRCFCAQAQKQVDKYEIYLAISSFAYAYIYTREHYKNCTLGFLINTKIKFLLDVCYRRIHEVCGGEAHH